MSGRVVRSAGSGGTESGGAGSGKAVSGRTVSGKAGNGDDASRAARRRPRRTVGGAASAGRASDSRTPAARSAPGQFVDARRLVSDDIVARTLEENSGALGLATRPKVVDFTERVKERKRVGMRVTVLRVVAVVAALAAVAGLGWLLFLSPVLRLESGQVTVSGANEWVGESQIRSIVDDQVGRSLLLVDTGALTGRMTGIAGVSKAKAVKRYPHGLAVTIEAQRPAAMLKERGGDALTAVDAKARVLNSVGSDASVEGVPVIEVADLDQGLDSRAVKETLKVLDSLPESLRAKITKVSAKTQDSVTTELDGGKHVVVWGNSSDLKLKKAVVDRILADPNVIGDKTQVDVSAPLRPVLR